MACIDGTTLEGGGQLLRISVGLSALTSIPIRITGIRANRRGKRGLKAQHLSAVQWLSSASRATTIGAEQQSQSLQFLPRIDLLGSPNPSQKANVIDIGTAGSIGLVFQAILPFILFSGSSSRKHFSDKPFCITIHGGTNVSLSPSYDYIDQVLLPTLLLLKLPLITTTLHQRGWMRGEKGAITFRIRPLLRGCHLPPFHLSNRGPVLTISATILAPSWCRTHAERALSQTLAASFPQLHQRGAVAITFEKSPQKCLYLLLVATSSNGYKLGRDWLYDEKIATVPVAVDRLVERVTAELVAEVRHGGCVDEYMRDQLVVFQALAKGSSRVDGGRDEGQVKVPPSLHARTAEWVVGKMLGARFDGEGGCQGVGFVAGERYTDRERPYAARRARRSASLAPLKERSAQDGPGSGRRARRLTVSGGDVSRALLTGQEAVALGLGVRGGEDQHGARCFAYPTPLTDITCMLYRRLEPSVHTCRTTQQ